MPISLPIRPLLAAVVLSSPLMAQYSWIHNPATGHWYARTQAVSSWTDAQAEAESLGGYLAVAEDGAENTWLYTNFSAHQVNDHGPWIGLYQDTSDPGYSEPLGAWKWINGAPLTYSRWDSGEPNNIAPGGEEYGQMHGDCCGGERWNDAPVSIFGGLWGIIEIESDPALLLQVSSLTAGSQASISVSGATPQNLVAIAYSRQGGGPTALAKRCIGTLVDLSTPIVLLDVVRADSAGIAALPALSIPSRAGGIKVWFDALDLATCRSSPGVQLEVR